MNEVNLSGVISRASGKPTKLKRVTTDSTNHASGAQKYGVNTGWQNYRCETSKELQHVKQCFECRKEGHSANECNNKQSCLRCSGKHTVDQCSEPNKMPSALIVANRTHLCTKNVPFIRTQLLRQQRESKASSSQE